MRQVLPAKSAKHKQFSRVTTATGSHGIAKNPTLPLHLLANIILVRWILGSLLAAEQNIAACHFAIVSLYIKHYFKKTKRQSKYDYALYIKKPTAYALYCTLKTLQASKISWDHPFKELSLVWAPRISVLKFDLFRKKGGITCSSQKTCLSCRDLLEVIVLKQNYSIVYWKSGFFLYNIFPRNPDCGKPFWTCGE